MTAAERNRQSIFSRFAAHLRSFGRRPKPAYAGQAKIARVGAALSAGIDLADLEVVQLVHDLRNHLTVMILCMNAMREGVPPGLAGQLSELRHAAEQASLMLKDLLIDSRSHRSLTAVDLNKVVGLTVVTVSRFRDRAIRLRLDLWPQPVAVAAEPGALERVVLNLVLNAREAMPEGGVLTIETAVAHAPRIPIEGMPAAPYARLRISDTGAGMTSEVRDRIFDAFFTTKETGTGLGLRSVAFTIQQLEGRISVESAPGRGTSVTVMLPLTTEPLVPDSSASRCPTDSRD